MSTFETKKYPSIDEQVICAKHRSGLKIKLIPKKFSSGCAAFGTRYGGKDSVFKLEGEKEFTVMPEGVAHYLEHKMFENEDGSDTFEKFGRYGTYANAYTSHDVTCYHFTSTNHFTDNLRILLDYVSHPYYTKENVDKEQGIIGQEIKMGDDNPSRALYYMLLNSLYESNPVKTKVVGTVESIAQITPELLYKCYNTFYNLSNMRLCVSADTTMEEILGVCDEVLKDQPEKKIIRRSFVEKDEVNSKYSEKKMSVSKPIFIAGIKDNFYSDDYNEMTRRSIVSDLLMTVLFGQSGDFYQEVYESGLINDFGYGANYSDAYGFCDLSGKTSEPEKAYEKIVECLKDAKNILKAEDFNRCKIASIASLVKSCDAVGIAQAEFRSTIFGGEIFDTLEMYRNVTFDEVVNLADELFQENHLTLNVVKPLKD
ncbi:MAG: insulinase family protein [Clostridiales bacterium]|nr:insulinase family protein [Clostridiales bacterium]